MITDAKLVFWFGVMKGNRLYFRTLELNTPKVGKFNF